jgi:hypothetical protein
MNLQQSFLRVFPGRGRGLNGRTNRFGAGCRIEQRNSRPTFSSDSADTKEPDSLSFGSCFQIELLAAAFIQQSPWREKDFFWFDWIVRDFFAYLYYAANTFITIPGTSERIFLGNEWQSRAAMAHGRALKACDYERDNLVLSAGEEWQKILGLQIPRTV